MTKRIAAKHKIARSRGCNLWGREKKRNYGPGEHGQKRTKKTSYGKQLNEKQKLKNYYGPIGERYFHNLFKKAVQHRGDTVENFIGLLEKRLDAVVYRAKLAPTIFAARQMVTHGHIQVNGKRVNIPSYAVSAGDEIQLATHMKDNAIILSALSSQDRDVPEYIQFDSEKKKGTYLRVPAFSEVPYPVQMEPQQIIEFYSR